MFLYQLNNSRKRNFSKKGGTRPPFASRSEFARLVPRAVGRFAPSGLPSLFPRLTEMIFPYSLNPFS